MDRTALIGGHGKGYFLDHGTQSLLLQGNCKFILHVGQLRIVRSRQAQNVEVGVAAGEMDHHAVISGEGHNVIGHTADDVAEKACVEHDVAAAQNIGRNFGADAGLHVVTGHSQLLVHVDQKTFQSGNGALLCNSAAGNSDGTLQQDFLTAKFNHGKLPLCITFAFKKEKETVFLEKAVVEKNFVEKWKKASVFKGLALHSRFWKTLSFFNRSFLEICFPQMVFPFPQEMWRLQRLELMLVLISLTTSA